MEERQGGKCERRERKEEMKRTRARGGKKVKEDMPSQRQRWPVQVGVVPPRTEVCGRENEHRCLQW